MRPSESSLSTGMLRDNAPASLPSASAQDAPELTPTSFNNVATGTPVHSLVLVQPSSCSTVESGGAPFQAPRVFPAHSRNMIRLTDGNRLRSSRLKLVGRSTMP